MQICYIGEQIFRIFSKDSHASFFKLCDKHKNGRGGERERRSFVCENIDCLIFREMPESPERSSYSVTFIRGRESFTP